MDLDAWEQLFFSVNLLRRNNNALLIEQIGLQGYVMDMINFGAIRFAIAPYWLSPRSVAQTALS